MRKSIIFGFSLLILMAQPVFSKEFILTGCMDTEGTKNPLFIANEVETYYFSFDRQRSIKDENKVLDCVCPDSNCTIRIDAKLLAHPQKRGSKVIVAGEYQITKVISVEEMP